jgi:hypothetical protein
MDGIDYLGVVDPLQVNRDDFKVRMTQLPLDHDERDAFPGHFDRGLLAGRGAVGGRHGP